MEEKKGCLSFLWRAIRRFLFCLLCLILLLGGLFCGFFSNQLYNRYSLYPRQAAAWKKYAEELQPVQLKTGWNEYRGVMHSHSEISHDSLVKFPEIVEYMHEARCDFIFMSDHFVDGKADYSLGWKGIHDGVLFIRGFEMQEGFFPWGLPDDTVFSQNDDPAELARRIRSLGGILCLGHNEEMRPWEIPEIDGMEIYNIHTDLKDEMADRYNKIETFKDLLINYRKYGDQALRGTFDAWILNRVVQKWDDMSKFRKISAYAANDCHQNVGIRGFYTENDTLMLLDTGHDDPARKSGEYKLNFATRPLLRLFFGELTPGKELFRIDLDPYVRSSRFVNTHFLAKELTEEALLDAVRVGRAFVAFNMLADAGGFAYIAESNGKQVTMGESIPLAPGLKLIAEAPLSCRFILIKKGKKVVSQDGKRFEFEVTEPGKYRLEAALAIPGEMMLIDDSTVNNMAPWIITNPIEVTAPAASVVESAPPQEIQELKPMNQSPTPILEETL